MISGITQNDKDILMNNTELEKFLVEYINTHSNEISLRKDGEKFNCRILKYYKSKNEYILKVNGKIISLKLSSTIEKTIKKIGLNNIDTQSVNELKSPMPGLIVEIKVKQGESIKKDQQLIVLEAMKMENVLTSPVDGIIKEIIVNPQQTVEKNSLLVIFE
jgi:biotin carboxyl carrier protein